MYKDCFDVVETFKRSFFFFSIVKCEPYGKHLDCQCELVIKNKHRK